MNLAILLATYNSSKYLEQQLDSLFSQTYNDFILYVRDDGSNDTTLDIISDYQNNYNIVLLDDSIKGRGAKNSFIWMLENVNADYYMFCDHDDVWLPNKIALSIHQLYKCNYHEPTLVYTDLKVVDQDLNITSNSFWRYMKLNRRMLIQKKFAISCNLFTGCTMLINRCLRDLTLPIAQDAVMHDGWIGLNAIKNNANICCVEESTILYRQHHNNVCGAHEIGTTIEYYIKKALGLKAVFNTYKANYRMAKSIFNDINIFEFIFWRVVYLIKR